MSIVRFFTKILIYVSMASFVPGDEKVPLVRLSSVDLHDNTLSALAKQFHADEPNGQLHVHARSEFLHELETLLLSKRIHTLYVRPSVLFGRLATIFETSSVEGGEVRVCKIVL